MPLYKLFQRGYQKPPFKLQEKDIEILKLVYDYRFLDSEHIVLSPLPGKLP